jgi:putative FmdB family regulatory protein
MPTYDHICENKECNHEWEDSYSIKVDPPKNCPKCGHETAKRLISCMSKGVVELTGQDYIDKIKSDTQQLKKDAAKSEKIYSNLLGEDKYQKMQTRIDHRKRNKY